MSEKYISNSSQGSNLLEGASRAFSAEAMGAYVSAGGVYAADRGAALKDASDFKSPNMRSGELDFSQDIYGHREVQSSKEYQMKEASAYESPYRSAEERLKFGADLAKNGEYDAPMQSSKWELTRRGTVGTAEGATYDSKVLVQPVSNNAADGQYVSISVKDENGNYQLALRGVLKDGKIVPQTGADGQPLDIVSDWWKQHHPDEHFGFPTPTERAAIVAAGQ